MVPPQSNEQLGDEPAMADVTPPQPDEQLGNELAPMQETVLMPYAAVDSSLRAMAGQAEGFGRHAIGGLHGDVYHVTTLEGTHD
jgi:pectate lyase